MPNSKCQIGGVLFGHLEIWRFVHLAICGEAALPISGEAGSLAPVFLDFGGEGEREGCAGGDFEFNSAVGTAKDFATHGNTRERDGGSALRTFAGGGGSCRCCGACGRSTHGNGLSDLRNTNGVKTTRAREEGPGEPADPVHRRRADGDVSVSDQDPLRGFFGGFGFEGFGRLERQARSDHFLAEEGQSRDAGRACHGLGDRQPTGRGVNWGHGGMK